MSKTPAETKIELLERMQTEGVTTAFDTALEVLRDAKAPAPAKATIVTTVFRVAGYLKGDAGADEPDFSKMSKPELDRFLRLATSELTDLEKKIEARRQANSAEDLDGVFA